jgi:hypothetical protein
MNQVVDFREPIVISVSLEEHFWKRRMLPLCGANVRCNSSSGIREKKATTKCKWKNNPQTAKFSSLTIKSKYKLLLCPFYQKRLFSSQKQPNNQTFFTPRSNSSSSPQEWVHMNEHSIDSHNNLGNESRNSFGSSTRDANKYYRITYNSLSPQNASSHNFNATDSVGTPKENWKQNREETSSSSKTLSVPSLI